MPDIILALPNPYSFVDDEGRAMGAFPHETAGPGDRRFVCAVIDEKETTYTGPPVPKGVLLERRQRTRFKFSSDPERVFLTKHYLDAFRAHPQPGLFVVDADGAAKVGITFVPPAEALAKARAAAIADYVAHHGHEPAFVAIEAGYVAHEHAFVALEVAAKAPAAPPAPAATPTHAAGDHAAGASTKEEGS